VLASNDIQSSIDVLETGALSFTTDVLLSFDTDINDLAVAAGAAAQTAFFGDFFLVFGLEFDPRACRTLLTEMGDSSKLVI